MSAKRESVREPAPRYEGWKEVLAEVEREKKTTVRPELAARVVAQLELIPKKISPGTAADRAVSLAGVNLSSEDRSEPLALYSMAKRLRRAEQSGTGEPSALPLESAEEKPPATDGVFAPGEWERIQKHAPKDFLHNAAQARDNPFQQDHQADG